MQLINTCFRTACNTDRTEGSWLDGAKAVQGDGICFTFLVGYGPENNNIEWPAKLDDWPLEVRLVALVVAKNDSVGHPHLSVDNSLQIYGGFPQHLCVVR